MPTIRPALAPVRSHPAPAPRLAAPAAPPAAAVPGGSAPGVTKAARRFPAPDGTVLLERSWLPAGATRGVLVIHHGLKDHSATYDAMATCLAARGYAVYAYDMRGHGDSAGARVRVRGFGDYVDDLKAFVEGVRARQPGAPVFVYGHSMGGQIVTRYLADHPAGVQGGILAAPAVRPTGYDGNLLERATLRGKTLLATLVAPIFPGFPALDLPNKDFARDPAVVAAMGRDPKVHQRPAPAHTALQLLRSIDRTAMRLEAVDQPLLIVHGTADRVSAYGGSRELHERAGGADKTFSSYEGAYHGLHLEPQTKNRLTSEVLDWLDARTPIAGGATNR